ncbi:MAG: transketolase [Flavobacteriales bacterium]|nr:MAG: transketolase [Flavobacteriales bacterium]
MPEQQEIVEPEISRNKLNQEIVNDYRIACESRQASLLGRREVLTGKAKFGIFGDGKEIPQIAMAKQYRNGDWRSGYYRDQTFMFAAGELNLQQFFAQLYAHADIKHDSHSGGRQMNAHFSTRLLNDDGSWKDQCQMKNTSSDMSPTSGQMPRLLGLAYASKFYRESEILKNHQKGFSKNGNEIAFGTIGDAATSEGLFWETVNAAGVLQVPVVLAVWDDGYGISVDKKYQTTKESISEILKGFKRDERPGLEVLKVKGWDYAACCLAFEDAARIAREEHVPVVVHVEEITQPQGHSTSGSHERYKSEDRLQWEDDFDCIKKMREWMIDKNIASVEELEKTEEEAKKTIREAKKEAWKAFQSPIKNEQNEVLALLNEMAASSANAAFVNKITDELKAVNEPLRDEVMRAAKKGLRIVRNENLAAKNKLTDWIKEYNIANHDRYNSCLYCETEKSSLLVKEVEPVYDETTDLVDGRIVLRENFDAVLSKYPTVVIFGEDAGKIGGVNQGLEGMQAKYGELRVFDTGIREATIIGQGIGLALRGLRPIAEIQYLDYLMFALQTISDDLASLHYRTKGGQSCPLIIRTRGHRLEGIWHAGSQLGMIINACRGLHVCVPRNMVQAAGFYNTLLQGDDPGLVIESLNGYRIKEKLPSNTGEFTIPLGVPEVMVEGTDVTLVTYGSMVRMAEEVAKQLKEASIAVEVIDVQTLLPFDINKTIVESLKKTNRILFVDEDMPGGATAYMMQEVLETQGGYYYLDSQPKTLTAKAHRPAYGSDGDYFSKPSLEDIFDAVYEIMHQSDPEKYPAIY